MATAKKATVKKTKLDLAGFAISGVVISQAFENMNVIDGDGVVDALHSCTLKNCTVRAIGESVGDVVSTVFTDSVIDMEGMYVSVVFRNCQFYGTTTFKNVDFSDVMFIDCAFNGNVKTVTCVDTDKVRQLDCTFSHGYAVPAAFTSNKSKLVVEADVKPIIQKVMIKPEDSPKLPDGDLIGYKKVFQGKDSYREIIAKLLIPEGAARTNANQYTAPHRDTLKCRAEKALVIDFRDFNNKVLEAVTTARGYTKSDFIYTVRQWAVPATFDRDLAKQCAGGIHFYTSFKAAVSHI